jgi:hypothetical protein
MPRDYLTAAELAAVRVIARIVREVRDEFPDAELCIAQYRAPNEYKLFMAAARRLEVTHLSLEAALSALESADVWRAAA